MLRRVIVVMVWGTAAISAMRTGTATAADERASGSTGGLIPRRVLFGNPDKTAAQISPDAKMVSYLAPLKGVLNVFVAPVDKPEAAKPVTHDTGRGIRQYSWAYNNLEIIFSQDKGGDENWHIFAANVQTGETRDLTPYEEITGPDDKPVMGRDGKPLRPAARIEKIGAKFPNYILVGLNTSDPRFHDVFRVDLATGRTELVLENAGKLEYGDFDIDDDFNIRFGTRFTREGAVEIMRPDGEKWANFATIGADDALTTQITGFEKSGPGIYMLDSRGRNTSALVSVNERTGAVKVLAEDPRCDAQSVLFHPTEHTPEAVRFTYDRARWEVLDPAVKGDFDYLAEFGKGDMDVISQSLDNQTWIVSYTLANEPARYYVYNRAAKKAAFLFTNRTELEKVKLSPMTPVIIKARDGMELVSYLTLPLKSVTDPAAPSPRPSAPLPLVLFVHGGPWGRDAWGFNGFHQWLANRGYAVLSVNFRGSTGFGKRFINAANREWGAKMHDDLLDAVNWAVEQKIADSKKVAIMGGSYGGYATLWGMTNSPDVFACGVSIVGPSNLVTLLNSIPEYWAPMIDMFATRVGDHRTEEGRSFLTKRSPLTHVERISKPLLIGQGANDPRVKQTESDQIVRAMQEKHIPVTYVLFSDEGHGFARPENRMAFNAITEAFLAQHLGGQVEPIGADFQNSTVAAPAGAENVPGLKEALGARK